MVCCSCSAVVPNSIYVINQDALLSTLVHMIPQQGRLQPRNRNGRNVTEMDSYHTKANICLSDFFY